MKTVSFDFDGTLTRQDVQNYAKSLIQGKTAIVIVVTSKFPYYPGAYNEVHKITDRIGINRKNIKFVYADGKVKFFKKHPVDLHLDNDKAIVLSIKKQTSTYAIDVTDTSWKEQANYVLY